MQRWRVEFAGRVQGVGFRYTACQIAKSLGVTGWVRNLPNGNVDLEAEGTDADLQSLISRLKTESYGSVDNVLVDKGSATGQDSGFSVRQF